MHLPGLYRDVPRPPRRDGAGIARDDGVVAQALAEFMRHHLRLHRLFHEARLLVHDLVPVLHPLLRFFEEAPVGLALEQRQQRREGTPAVADQPDLYWIPQPDALWIELDL